MSFNSQTIKLDQVVRPPRLLAGDTIGIAAPSGPFKSDLFQKGMHVLRGMGFKVHVPEAVFKHEGFLAGPDAVRAGVINDLFADPAINGILCARGGYGSTRVLPYLDWEAIRSVYSRHVNALNDSIQYVHAIIFMVGVSRPFSTVQGISEMIKESRSG